MNKRCKSKKEARYKDTQMSIKENFSVLYISKRLGVEREAWGRVAFHTLSHHGGGGGEGACAPVHVPTCKRTLRGGGRGDSANLILLREQR